MFTFFRTIKVAVPHEPGELVFEFNRPTVKEKNQYTAAKNSIETEGEKRMNELADLRIALFNKFASKVYGEKDNKQFPVQDESERELTPADFPDDMKIDIVVMGFDMNHARVRNF